MNFTILGAGGYVARRHLQAIKDTGNDLIAAFDPDESAKSVVNEYFPNARFFSHKDQYSKFIGSRSGKIDYTSICTPSFLHKQQIIESLSFGIDVICEKPLVLNIDDLKTLQKYEKKSGAKIYTILQLRKHPILLDIKKRIFSDRFYDVSLTYITPREQWFYESWHGNKDKSGGIAFNIGIHFFDMLLFMFGAKKSLEVYVSDYKKLGGFISFENADVRFYLSTDENDSKQPLRHIVIDGFEYDFSKVSDDLHTVAYKDVISGRGVDMDDSVPSLYLSQEIANADQFDCNDFSRLHSKLIQ